MTTYYVDGTNGSNSNSGLTPSLAYLTMQKFATVMVAGDTCKVFGNNTYTTAGGVVTIDEDNVTVEQYETDGTPIPIIDASGTSASCIRVDGGSNVTIRRFHLINATANGMNHANAVDGGLIEDCIAEDCLGNGFASFGTATGTVTYRRCVALNNVGDGFSQRGAQNVDCEDCYSSGHTGLNVSDGFTSHDTGDMNIYRCTSVGNRHGATLTSSGDHVIEDFISTGSLENGLRFTTAAGTLVVDRACIEAGTSYGVRADTGTITIKNSLIVIPTDATASCVGVYVDDSGTINAYNCVILNHSESNTTYSFGSLATATAGVFLNNISLCTGSAALHWGANAAGTIDYNIYFPDTGDRFYFGATGYTFSEWQTFSTQEANSLNSDPLLRFTDYAIPNFTSCMLRRGSPAIGRGTDLSGTFTTDCRGHTRSSWDIGCHEFSASRFGSGNNGTMMEPLFGE